MAIPFGPGNSPPNTYVVQFTFPKVDSIISEGKTALMIPNADYLVKFIGGNIGIADSMFQSTMFKNLNSPIASSNEMVFRSFAKTNKIDIGDDISKYKGSNGKLKFPKDEINLSPENDLVGLKALEVTTLKSIFETQKPYIEIAKLVIGNLAKLEDITARVMPLLGIPLSTKSKKPKGNPEAVGYQSGSELKKELARIKSIQKKGGETKLNKNGEPIRSNGGNNQPLNNNSNSQNNGPFTWDAAINQFPNGKVSSMSKEEREKNIKIFRERALQAEKKASDFVKVAKLTNDDERKKWEGYRSEARYWHRQVRLIESTPILSWQIVSTVYSTGEFNPNVDYNYNYIDLPADEGLTDQNSDLDLDEETDPYKKYKPKTIILGIFDSRGTPLNPLSKVKAIDNLGNKVPTNFNKADWLLRSPKWVLPTQTEGTYKWPTFAAPNYLTDSDGNVIKYVSGEKNILDKDVDAIAGNPKITGFGSVQETEYRNFFSDLIGIKMLGNDEITQQERSQISNEVSGMLNVQSHLQNVFLYGQSKSSIYKRIGIPGTYLQKNGLTSQDDPFPGGIKRSLKPYRIYSNEAAGDEKLRAYARSKGRPESDAGWIWIDPESDYVTKVIRVDPTTRISYKFGEGEPEVQSEIKAFTKNLTVFEFSDGREFNAEVYRSTNGTSNFDEFVIEEGITSYNLENWNYIDNDGIISQFGVVNEEPELSNTNSYKITFWGTTPTPYYDTGENLYASTQVSSTYLKVDEVKKEGDNWKLNKLEYDISSSGQDISGISYTTISEIYLSYKSNPNYQYISGSVSISASSLFSNVSDVTEDGKQRLNDKSLVEVENGVITKWYYMTPNDDTDDYGNGRYNSELPNNGTKRTITIDVNTIGNDNLTPLDSFEDETIPKFQIRVRDDDSKGRIIDPSKILNEQLTTSEPFSTGKYGYGDQNNQQEIDVIKRYMLTELDTESYYIIEGVLPELVDNEGRYNNGSGSSSSGGSSGSGSDDGYYKLPDAIGAIKVFISVLGDIFGKLIPTIVKLLSLFKNPASFVTQIISEQMKEGFLFATPDALNAFKEALDIKKNIPSKDIDNGRERKRAVKNLENFFKNSSLSNFVYVREDGNFNSVLDGVGGIPFSIFGKDIPFGMELNMSKVPSPLNLSFPSNINFNKVKNLQSFISPKSFDDTNTSNLFGQINDASKPLDLDNKYPFSNLDGIDRTGGNTPDRTKIEFQDGSSVFIPDNSLDEFILSNETKYNFIYVNENTQAKLEEANELIESGTEENIEKALNILDGVSKRLPNNKEISDLKLLTKNKLQGIKAGQQPLLKMLLGLVTLPIKIIGGIIEWIMNFFKKLSNPLKLPSLIAELLSFQWIMQFFTPKGLLEMAGIKFKPEKIAEWAALSKLPTIPDNVDLADLSEFLNVAFNVKLPTYTKGQYSEIDPRMPLRLITSLFCFVENLINGIIDFIWSTLGIEAVIPPPHIKLCSDTDLSTMNPEDISKVLNGEIPKGSGDGGTDSNGDGKNDDFDGFYYEVELPDGSTKRFLDREQLDKFIEDNKDINYDFTF